MKRFDNSFPSGIDQELLQTQHPEDDGVHELGGHSWRDSEGERLDDFGVEENVDFYDEDEIPLAKLKERKSTFGRPMMVT